MFFTEYVRHALSKVLHCTTLEARASTKVKKCEGEAPCFTQTEKGKSDTKAWGVREDMRRKKRTEPTQLYPKWTPACQRQTQNAQERNQAELPIRLGLEWAVSDIAPLASASEGTLARSERVVACGKRCRCC